MVFEKIFGGGFKEVGEDEYIELDTSSSDAPAGKVSIKVDKMDDFSDTDRIQKAVRDGSIVLVKIKGLKDKDLTDLKRAIDKLRRTCIALNGDIAGIDESWIIVCPNFAHVTRD